MVLVRWRESPIGRVVVECDPDGRVRAATVRQAVATDWDIGPMMGHRAVRQWLLRRPAAGPVVAPTWSIVVCTRDRADDLARCLAALDTL